MGENKKIAEALADVLSELPDGVKTKLQENWTSEAIGAKKVFEMMKAKIEGKQTM